MPQICGAKRLCTGRESETEGGCSKGAVHLIEEMTGLIARTEKGLQSCCSKRDYNLPEKD